MYLKTLHLREFRNYQDCLVNFSAPKTILVGNNAQGKSNLLEAVELLATLKSHRVVRDRDLVRVGTTAAKQLVDYDEEAAPEGFGASAGKIEATLERATGLVDLALTLRTQGRRTYTVNQESLRRQQDFLGILNAVQFSSLDLELVRGAPDRRRNWLDSLLIQLEPVYAHILQQYNQVLRQRNALLRRVRGLESEVWSPQIKSSTQNSKFFVSEALEAAQHTDSDSLSNIEKDSATHNSTELALWDLQLATAGSRVTRRRARVLRRLAPLAQAWHTNISGSLEALELRYVPSVSLEHDEPDWVKQAFLEKIQQRRIAEQHQGTTLVGPHRDEVEFTINQTPARAYGSQGQQRTLVLALKLAELKLIEEVVGEPPLLLLDDVLAELDPYRQDQLLDAIQDRFQTLITTTHLGSFDAQWLNSSQILSVQAGQISARSSF